MGSKDSFSNPNIPLYNFTGLARTAKQANLSAVFVVGNYRLGALGWLSGSYLESLATDDIAYPNAAFYDQQLLIQWVRKHIHLLHGNSSDISLWGESAGAGSLVYHLLANNGTRDPGFRKAVAMSPAFSWQWDRKGSLDEVYRNFSRVAGCGEQYDIECLQSLSSHQIKHANQHLFQHGGKCTGLFVLGPALDGILFDDLPPVAFANGKSLLRSKGENPHHVQVTIGRE